MNLMCSHGSDTCNVWLGLTWLFFNASWFQQDQPIRDNVIPDLLESFEDNIMVARRIQLKKAIKKLLEIFFRVYLFLQDHLQHGMPEILIRVAGILLDGDAVDDFLARFGIL